LQVVHLLDHRGERSLDDLKLELLGVEGRLRRRERLALRFDDGGDVVVDLHRAAPQAQALAC